MNEQTIEEIIAYLLADQDEIRSAQTFGEAGMLTRNNGLVVRTIDGSEFQITIVKSN